VGSDTNLDGFATYQDLAAKQRERDLALGLEIIADEIVLYNDGVGVVPVPLPDPTFLCAGRILFYVRGGSLR
jgi:hypothetical protein